MKYTIEEIRQMPEGQTFDCKSIFIESKHHAVSISDKTRRVEGVDRMCRKLRVLGVREPQYNLVAFIMKATVYANVLEKEQETTQTDYPENAQKLPRNYPETAQIDPKGDPKSDQKATRKATRNKLRRA